MTNFWKIIESIIRKRKKQLLISTPILIFVTYLLCVKVVDEAATAILVNNDYEVKPVEKFYTNSYFILSLYLIPVIFSFLSLVYLIKDGLYLRTLKNFILYALFYFSHFLTSLLLIFTISLTSPQLILGNEFFYKQKFKEHTDLDLNFSFDISCKTDTIIGIGPGGGDFSAICLFTMDKQNVIYIENSLKNDTTVSLINSSDFSESHCSYSLFFDNIYQCNRRNDLESTISFSKDRKSILFKLDYW